MKVLFVNACLRKQSRTLSLAKYLLEKMGQPYEQVDVQNEEIASLDEKTLIERDRKDLGSKYFSYAKQFKEADIIVIASPYYDLSFSAKLKDYLETINIVDLTFAYNEQGMPYSLSQVKKVIYVTTAGGPIISHEYGYGYIETFFKAFYGVQDFEYYHAEELDIIGADEKGILDKVRAQIDEKYEY